MSEESNKTTSGDILREALVCGADLAGIAALSDIKRSPSHVIYAKLAPYESVSSDDGKQHHLTWPEKGQCTIVIAVAHPEEQPELDWYRPGYSGGTPGNRKLIEIAGRLSRWLDKKCGIKSRQLPYHIGHGGLFLKDMAVLAGLGCMGKNNMLVTPALGPRVRIRGIVTDVPLAPSSPLEFDPCSECPMPCRRVCPEKAFGQTAYTKSACGIDRLPAREGVYDRDKCRIQMERDNPVWGNKKAESDETVHWCRRCEFACPVGK